MCSSLPPAQNRRHGSDVGSNVFFGRSGHLQRTNNVSRTHDVIEHREFQLVDQGAGLFCIIPLSRATVLIAQLTLDLFRLTPTKQLLFVLSLRKDEGDDVNRHPHGMQSLKSTKTTKPSRLEM